MGTKCRACRYTGSGIGAPADPPMSVAQGELRRSLRAGRRSGVLARTSISARLNRGGPDVTCRVQSGASDELPLSGHALRWQSVASAGRRRLTERRACGRTTCSCWSAQWRPHTRGKPRLLDVGRRILARDRFAPDSPLEGAGFELSVPRQIAKVFRGSGGLIKAAGASARPRCRLFLTHCHWRRKNAWLLDH